MILRKMYTFSKIFSIKFIKMVLICYLCFISFFCVSLQLHETNGKY